MPNLWRHAGSATQRFERRKSLQGIFYGGAIAERDRTHPRELSEFDRLPQHQPSCYCTDIKKVW